MVGHGTLETAKTVLEVADMAWTAIECSHHLHHHHNETPPIDTELESLRSENRRLRNLLQQNLNLLQNLSESPFLQQDCPPHLHDRLMDTVHSDKFLSQLKSLHQNSVDGAGREFPFKEASEKDFEAAEILINMDGKEPSWWVWVSDDMVHCNVEERSGIDSENYVVVSEEHVVDGVANFMAKCILANPKAQSLSPEKLQKTLTHALSGTNKFEMVLNIWHAGNLFYALSTWGLALAGLYHSRAVLKVAARGIHATSKVVLKAL